MKQRTNIGLLLLFYMSTQALSQTSPPDNIYPPPDIDIPTHSEWTKTHYPERIADFKVNPLDTSDIVFLGNSITEQGGNWGARFGSDSLSNRGISGDVTDGVLARLGELYYFPPKKVFLLIGINDMFHASLTAEYIGNNILRIADSLQKYVPETEVYVQTILPTTNDELINKIIATNKLIRDAEASHSYHLIDLYPLFADMNDRLITSYTVDGIHLTEEGYSVWIEAIKHLIPSIQTDNLLKNPDLLNGSGNWEMNGSEFMFKTIDWSPAEGTLRSFGNNYWQWANRVVNGTVTQTVKDLQNGEYRFSCQFIGATPGEKAHSALIAKDGNLDPKIKEFTMPSVWTKIELVFNVTRGESTVGFAIKDTLNSEFWFAASDFKLLFISPFSRLAVDLADPTLFYASPNPFREETTLTFQLPYSVAAAEIDIFDARGKLVYSQVENQLLADTPYRFRFTATQDKKGLYLARLKSSSKVYTTRLLAL